MKKILILKVLPPGGLLPAALPRLTLELQLGRPSPSRPPPRKSTHGTMPTGLTVREARPLRLRPLAGRTRATGRRAAALTTRARREEQRLWRAPLPPPRRSRPLGHLPQAHPLRSLPSRAAPLTERAYSQPLAGPRETPTRAGRFLAPRVTRCPRNHLLGRPFTGSTETSGAGRGPRAPSGSGRAPRPHTFQPAEPSPSASPLKRGPLWTLRGSGSRFSAELSMAFAMRSAGDRLPHALRRDKQLLPRPKAGPQRRRGSWASHAMAPGWRMQSWTG